MRSSNLTEEDLEILINSIRDNDHDNIVASAFVILMKAVRSSKSTEIIPVLSQFIENEISMTSSMINLRLQYATITLASFQNPKTIPLIRRVLLESNVNENYIMEEIRQTMKERTQQNSLKKKLQQLCIEKLLENKTYINKNIIPTDLLDLIYENDKEEFKNGIETLNNDICMKRVFNKRNDFSFKSKEI